MKTLPLCALLLSVAPTLLAADIDRGKKPEPGPAPAASFPDYKIQTLSNGLKVFVIEDDRKPTLTLRLLIKSGTAMEADKTGLAGFVAGLLNRGTEKRDAATFATESDFIGMQLEGMAGPDSITVSASGLTKYTDKILDLFSDAVLRPAYPAEQFAKEQRKTLSALEAERQDPARLAAKLSGKVLYGPKNPYGAYRTSETVQAITREEVVKFHRTHFIPNNATLAIVGDVKTAEIVPLVEKALQDWKPGELPAFSMLAPAEINRDRNLRLQYLA
ncbi:MAG: pitrilysin family protein, partial [Verrucomicrobiota bacterium]